jgi:hypothetical protein
LKWLQDGFNAVYERLHKNVVRPNSRRTTKLLKLIIFLVAGRVARFVLVQTYQNGKNIQKDLKTIPNGFALYQMAINYP